MSTQSKTLPNHLPKLGVIFLGRRRPGFDMEWGRGQEEKVRGWLRGAGFATVEPAEKAVDEPSMRRAVTGCTEQGAQVMVLLQTTMGDGRLAPTLAQLWPDPLILWATPEKPDGDMISSCSLVGAHCWGSVLRQMGHPFEVVYGDPDATETRQSFSEAVRIAAAPNDPGWLGPVHRRYPLGKGGFYGGDSLTALVGQHVAKKAGEGQLPQGGKRGLGLIQQVKPTGDEARLEKRQVAFAMRTRLQVFAIAVGSPHGAKLAGIGHARIKPGGFGAVFIFPFDRF